MNRDFLYWTRWVFALPISLLFGFLADFPVHFILYRTLSGGENPFIYPYPALPEQLIAPFFRALIYMWSCSKIAPDHKLITGIIFSAIWILGAGGVFFLGIIGFQIGNTKLTMVAGGLPIIFGVVGIILGLFMFNKELLKSIISRLNK